MGLAQEDLTVGRVFNLAICDGAVLQPHRQSFASNRDKTETTRLQSVQLALALEHLIPGGTIIFRPHQIDQWETVKLLYQFSKFAKINASKPTKAHQQRSSFYVVVTDVDSTYAEALKAVEKWKSVWRAATLMTEQEYAAYLEEIGLDANIVLQGFGQRLVDLGKQVWEVQAEALSKAAWVK